MLEFNLQFFAEGSGGEKTEEPTAKKLGDARKEGQVAKSKEMGSALILMSLFLTLKVAVSYVGTSIMELFAGVYGKIPDYTDVAVYDVNGVEYASLLSQMIIRIMLIGLPFFAVAVLISIIVEVAQVKWEPTAKPLMPKLSKINPIKGFKKIFSTRSLMELFKSIAKVLIIYYLVYSTLSDRVGLLRLLYEIPLNTALSLVGDIVINLGIKISAFYIILAIVDLIYEKRKFKNDMKMTKQEVKDEFKQSEGDPQVKGKIKQRMREASQRRMMQALPEADVVITNPTHLAVAVKYDSEVHKAPVVLAKGEDFLAQKIKEIAKEHNVEIVENKPLARMLYYNVDIDEEIPPELYQAVAEVLALVYQKKK